MIYLCIFCDDSEDNIKLIDCIIKKGFKEVNSVYTGDISDIDGNMRCNRISLEEKKRLEDIKHVVASFELTNGEEYSLIKPFGSSKFFTLEDIHAFKYLKEFYGEQMIAIHIKGDIDRYWNRLTDASEGLYNIESDIVIDRGTTLEEKIRIFDEQIGGIKDEDMS